MDFCVRLKAPNDRNGNPRRMGMFLAPVDGYVAISRLVEEGYSGDQCAQGPEIHIAPAEFNRLRKMGRERGIWQDS